MRFCCTFLCLLPKGPTTSLRRISWERRTFSTSQIRQRMEIYKSFSEKSFTLRIRSLIILILVFSLDQWNVTFWRRCCAITCNLFILVVCVFTETLFLSCQWRTRCVGKCGPLNGQTFTYKRPSFLPARWGALLPWQPSTNTQNLPLSSCWHCCCCSAVFCDPCSLFVGVTSSTTAVCCSTL
jgi:hypothetical protein